MPTLPKNATTAPAGPVNGSPLLAARICHDDGQTARR